MSTRTPHLRTADHTEHRLDMVGRWYMVTQDGAATLCVDREDAEAEARKADREWPRNGPHRAVRLVEASFEAAARLEIESLRAAQPAGAQQPAQGSDLYTTPQPSPAVQGDALDAARLDWLTFNLSGKALRDIGVVWSEHGDARRAIDAARAAQEGNKP